MDGRTDSSSSYLTTVSCEEEDKWTDGRTEDSSSLTTVSCDEDRTDGRMVMNNMNKMLFIALNLYASTFFSALHAG